MHSFHCHPSVEHSFWTSTTLCSRTCPVYSANTRHKNWVVIQVFQVAGYRKGLLSSVWRGPCSRCSQNIMKHSLPWSFLIKILVQPTAGSNARALWAGLRQIPGDVLGVLGQQNFWALPPDCPEWYFQNRSGELRVPGRRTPSTFASFCKKS